MTQLIQFAVPQVKGGPGPFSTPVQSWTPDSSSELTAFQTLAGSTKAHIWTFDGDSNRQNATLQGAVQDAQPIGLAYDWNNPNTVEYQATTPTLAAADTRPLRDTENSIIGAKFDGDRADNDNNSRLGIPHITASTGFFAVLARLDRADSGAQEVVAQINHWRAGMYWGAVGETSPHVRAGNNVRVATGGSSPNGVWTALYIKWQTGSNYLAVRRDGGDWVTGTLDSGEPWMSASSSNQVSYLGRGGYDASAGPPFSGLIHRAIVLEKLPADATEEQTIIDMLLLDTGLTDTAPDEGTVPDPGEYVELLDPEVEVNVTNNTELNAALAGTVSGVYPPGTHIILANGTYNGVTLTANGTANAPYVIRSLNDNGATISGGITANGDFWTIHRVNHAGSTGIVVNSEQFRWLRGELSPTAGQKIFFSESAYNGEVGFFESSGGSNAIEVDVDENYSGSFRPSHWFHHGWIYGTSGSPVEIGLNWRHSLTKQNNCLEYCIVEDCGNNSALAMKSSDNLYAFITVLDCGTRRAGTRHGSGNIWYGCRLVNSAGIILRGSENKCVGCVKVSGPTGAWSDMGACAGDTDYFTEFVVGTDQSTRYHPNSYDAKFIGCQTHTSIRDGGTGSSYTKAATRTRIEGNPLPSIVTGPGPTTGRTTSTVLSEPVPDVVILSSSNPAHVGVDADWSTGPSVRYMISDLGIPATAEPTVAELYANPFSSESAFHRPIGTGAVYADDTHASRVAWVAVVPADNGEGGGGTIGAINQGNPFGVASVYGTGSDPLRTIRFRNCTDSGSGIGVWEPGGTSTTRRIPTTNGINTSSLNQCFENTAWIVNDGSFDALELFQGNNRGGGDYTGSIGRIHDIRGLGHGAALGERVGVSASGCSVRMGMLSAASLLAQEEIEHALKLAIYSGTGSEAYELLSRNIQWPACNADSFASNSANNNGPIPYGALLAIPTSTDLATLGLATPQGYILGRAMQNYGCYAMDDANGIVLRADGSLGASASSIVSDYRKLLRHLRMVLNSVSGATASIAADGGYNQTGSIGTPTGTSGNAWPAGGGTALAANRALI